VDVTDSGVPVDQLVAAVKNAICRANISSTDTGRDLRVTAAYLKLNAIAATTAGGKLDFRIPLLGLKLALGRSVTRQDTHTLEMTLIPTDLSPGHEIRDSSVETALVNAIDMLRTVMAGADGGNDPFVLKDSTVELSFAVTDDGSISLGIDGDFKDEITHTLRLTLEPPSGPA
jgi:hypothetical protein